MDAILTNFHFLRPYMLWGLLPLLVLGFMQLKQKGSIASWQKVVAPELLAYLQVGQTKATGKIVSGLFLLAGLLTILALAGPAWKQLPQPLYDHQSSLVVVLDLSASMNAADVKPSRLIRAKQKLTDLLKLRKEGQTALVVFAGSAFVVTPLTDDNDTILSQLQGLTTDIMPVQGGDIDSGIDKAKDLFEQAGVKHGQILLMTDSDLYSKEMLEKVTQAGFSMHVIGLGTPEGAPIPKPQTQQSSGGFITDNQGNIVIAKLDEKSLRTLALVGQGSYHRLTIDDSDIEQVIGYEGETIWQDGEKKTTSTQDVWQEEGAWLLLLVLPMTLLMFRRGLWVLVLCVWMSPSPAKAVDWLDVWQTPDQHAETLMTQEKYDEAANTFENEQWKAAAAYKAKNYEMALKAANEVKQKTSDDWYNQGNILAQMGKLDEAIQAYDQALKSSPKDKDVLANKALVENLKKQQEKDKKQKDNQDKGQESKQEQKKQNQDKQGQDKQGKDKQGKDKQEEGKDKQDQQGDDKGDKSNQNQQGQPDQQQSSEQGSPQDGQQGSPQDKNQKNQQVNKDKQSSDAKDSNENKGDLAKQDKAEEEAKAKQQAQEQQAQQESKPKDKQLEQSKQSGNLDVEKTEAQQAFEQSLRRVPDDPSGLLRRKFLYQYQKQAGQQPQRGNPW